MFDLDFQGHAIKIEFFHYHRWIPWPRKHTHEKYFQKIRTGRQKSRGGCINPPLGVFGWRNTLGVCGLIKQSSTSRFLVLSIADFQNKSYFNTREPFLGTPGSTPDPGALRTCGTPGATFERRRSADNLNENALFSAISSSYWQYDHLFNLT